MTFATHRTLHVGGERIDLAWHGTNHTPDNIYIHFPDHDALMLVDILLPGWVPYNSFNLNEDARSPYSSRSAWTSASTRRSTREGAGAGLNTVPLAAGPKRDGGRGRATRSCRPHTREHLPFSPLRLFSRHAHAPAGSSTRSPATRTDSSSPAPRSVAPTRWETSVPGKRGDRTVICRALSTPATTSPPISNSPSNGGNRQ